jgi:hypothetical protein
MKVLNRKFNGRQPVGKPRLRCEDIIRTARPLLTSRGKDILDRTLE